MKIRNFTSKLMLAAVFALTNWSAAAAQEYEYVPLVREGVTWVYYYYNASIICDQISDLYCDKELYTMEFRGDTTLAGITFKKLIATHKGKEHLIAMMREENKCVYLVWPQEHTFDDFVLYGTRFGKPTENAESIGELLLYDFDNFYDVVNLNSHEEDQMIEINGKLRKKHVISTYSPFNGSYENRCIIEGIGCDGNFVGSFPGVYNTLIVYCDCSRTRGLARVIGPDGQVEYRGWYDQIGPAAISATTHDYPITISAADGMILVTSQPSASGTVEVINMAGQVVSRLIVDGVRQMSTRPLPKGAYVVQYYDGIIRKTQKVSL